MLSWRASGKQWRCVHPTDFRTEETWSSGHWNSFSSPCVYRKDHAPGRVCLQRRTDDSLTGKKELFSNVAFLWMLSASLACALLISSAGEGCCRRVHDTKAPKAMHLTAPSNLYKLDDLVLHQVQFAFHRVRCINEDIDAIITYFSKEDLTSILEPLNPRQEIG